MEKEIRESHINEESEAYEMVADELNMLSKTLDKMMSADDETVDVDVKEDVEDDNVKYDKASLKHIEDELIEIRTILDEKLNLDFNAMYDNLLEQMNVEAIKIYRNIQAVIIEENAKQNQVLYAIDKKQDKLKSRLNHVLIFAIISFVTSILVMIIQILPFFGINLL